MITIHIVSVSGQLPQPFRDPLEAVTAFNRSLPEGVRPLEAEKAARTGFFQIEIQCGQTSHQLTTHEL